MGPALLAVLLVAASGMLQDDVDVLDHYVEGANRDHHLLRFSDDSIRVYGSSGNVLYATDTTGSVLWTWEVFDGVTDLLFTSARIFLLSGQTHLTIADKMSGNRMWETFDATGLNKAHTDMDGDGEADIITVLRNTMEVRSAGSGAVIWTRSFSMEKQFVGGTMSEERACVIGIDRSGFLSQCWLLSGSQAIEKRHGHFESLDSPKTDVLALFSDWNFLTRDCSMWRFSVIKGMVRRIEDDSRLLSDKFKCAQKKKKDSLESLQVSSRSKLERNVTFSNGNLKGVNFERSGFADCVVEEDYGNRSEYHSNMGSNFKKLLLRTAVLCWTHPIEARFSVHLIDGFSGREYYNTTVVECFDSVPTGRLLGNVILFLYRSRFSHRVMRLDLFENGLVANYSHSLNMPLRSDTLALSKSKHGLSLPVMFAMSKMGNLIAIPLHMLEWSGFQISEKSIISHSRRLVGIERIVTSAMALESELKVECFGFDSYSVVLTPNSHFDIISETKFQKALLATLVGVLLVGAVVTTKMRFDFDLNRRWA